MRNILIATAAIAAFSTPVAFADVSATPASVEISQVVNAGADFEKRKKTLKGSFSIIEQDGQRILRLSDNFKAANGPDLKVFLSPTAYDDVTGKTAVNGAVNLGELQKTRGSQDYIIPADLDLSDFQSVLVHCEAYAVLWGGADLT